MSARNLKPKPVSRFAVSFAPALAEEVRHAAEAETGGNVSAWLAAAAQRTLRRQAAREALDVYEAEHGRITQAELDETEREWPRG